MRFDRWQSQTKEVRLSSLTSAAGRVRALLSAKLGRCAYCIRWSGKGAILSWGAVVAELLVKHVTSLSFMAVGTTTLCSAAAVRCKCECLPEDPV
jgi:hypothetical protein